MSQFLKWAADMDAAASAVEAASDGSIECAQIIDGNRAIAEVLRQAAAIERERDALISKLGSFLLCAATAWDECADNGTYLRSDFRKHLLRSLEQNGHKPAAGGFRPEPTEQTE